MANIKAIISSIVGAKVLAVQSHVTEFGRLIGGRFNESGSWVELEYSVHAVSRFGEMEFSIKQTDEYEYVFGEDDQQKTQKLVSTTYTVNRKDITAKQALQILAVSGITFPK